MKKVRINLFVILVLFTLDSQGRELHAAVDAQIRKNRIHHTGRGIWLDWMTQGTRVSGNLFYDNDMEDIFLEVNHGPFVVDNNIFLSPVSIRTQSEGGAYLHNLIAGAVYTRPDLNRFTPYFLPHSTDIGALTIISGGDDRYYNNIFVGQDGNHDNDKFGLMGYNQVKLPVWMNGNVYYNGANPSAKDTNMLIEQEFNPEIKLIEEYDAVYLEMAFSAAMGKLQTRLISSEILGKALIPKTRFDNPDGSTLIIDTDYFGKKRATPDPTAGPFENTGVGTSIVKVW